MDHKTLEYYSVTGDWSYPEFYCAVDSIDEVYEIARQISKDTDIGVSLLKADSDLFSEFVTVVNGRKGFIRMNMEPFNFKYDGFIGVFIPYVSRHDKINNLLDE